MGGTGMGGASVAGSGGDAASTSGGKIGAGKPPEAPAGCGCVVAGGDEEDGTARSVFVIAAMAALVARRRRGVRGVRA
jgi:hypothetical protein